MATSVKEIAGFMEARGWKFETVEDQGFVRVILATEKYVDSQGEQSVLLIVEVMDEGKSWRAFIPKLYTIEDGPNSVALMKAFLYCTFMSKFAAWEVDLESGDVQISVRGILSDGSLTQAQFDRTVEHLGWAVDYYHQMIVEAKETGVLNPPVDESPVEALCRRIASLSPAGQDRVKAGIDAALAKAVENAPAPETL